MKTTTFNLAEFRRKLLAHFNNSELHNLAFDLGVDYEGLSGQNKNDKARELLAHFKRNVRLPELLDACRGLRPDVSWESIIIKEETSIREREPRSSTTAVVNPFFTGGRINDEDLFFGRERLVREICNELVKWVSISLVGASQIGKSSLLNYLYLTRARWRPGISVIYLDLQSILDEQDFCETILARMGMEGDTLRDLKRGLYGHDLVLLLDEVERLAEEDFNPRLHDLLRSLSQEPNFAMCLATDRPLQEVFPARTASGVSPFHNIFVPKTIAGFSEEECRSFLATRLATTAVTFTNTEIENLIQTSAGHPAILQQMARDLFDRYARHP